MNNKSRVFVAIHKAALASSKLQSKETEIGIILLDIAHLYLKAIKDIDESDYWITFVFDTCCSAGLCSIQYIDYLDPKQKRDYIQATLKEKMGEPDKKKLCMEGIIEKICKAIRSCGAKTLIQDSEKRMVASLILDYTHTLTSIDRDITDEESIFFRSLRDGVYQRIGWQNEVLNTAKSQGHEPSQRTKENGNKENDRTVEDLISEINSLIGLDNIKTEVKSLVNSLQVQQMRQSQGLPNPEVSNHMVFFGNPGTGKTTIARQLGHLYRQLGILSKGHFVETDRGGLVGGYLGQTALKTTEVLNSALGGILFIDEAYALSSTHGEDQYGQEAIDTMLKYMEDHRDDLIVIAAGYENLMGDFLKSNPGMKSRFNKYFRFADYSEVELAEIFLCIASKSSYFLDEYAQEHLRKLTKEIIQNKPENFGNGRTMRNLFERSLANQANRIIAISSNDKADLQRLTAEDIRWDDLVAIMR